MFVDEKTFRSDQSGNVHVWRPDGTRYHEENVNAVRRIGHISVNMFGWVSASGVGELTRIENRLTGNVISHTIKNYFLLQFKLTD